MSSGWQEPVQPGATGVRPVRLRALPCYQRLQTMPTTPTTPTTPRTPSERDVRTPDAVLGHPVQCRRKDSNLHEHRWLTRPSTQRVAPLPSVLRAVPCKVRTLECTACNIPKWHEMVRGVTQGVTPSAAGDDGYVRGALPDKSSNSRCLPMVRRRWLG